MQSPTYPRASECIDPDDDPLSPHHAFLAQRVVFKELQGSQMPARLRAALPDTAREWLVQESFEELGAYQESLSRFLSPKFNRLVHADPQRIVRLDLGINHGRDFGARQGFVYHFSTYFENGTAIITWSHLDPKTQSSGRLESWGSVGGLAEDYAAHRARVETHLAREAIPLKFESLADVRATHFHYYRRIANEADALRLHNAWRLNLVMLIATPIYILATILIIYFKTVAG